MLALALALLVADPVNAGAVVQAKKARSILVLDLQSSVVDAGTLSTITNTLAVSVQKRPGLSVLTGQDVKRMAQVEADKQVLGCDSSSTSCIAEIAGAMGADLVLYGDVGKLSDLYVVNLNLFDAGRAKAVGRQSVQVKTFDESFIAQLDIAVRTLLAPITGESTGVSLAPSSSGADVPTIDLEALKSSGLKAINMNAERALDAAIDAQQDPHATPARKRDVWCALAHVEGANPYLEPATKACSDWTRYVVADRDLEKSMTADFQTLSGFLSLKHKSQEQKLEAIDAFLKSYARLAGRPMVKSVEAARARLVATGNASLMDSDGDGIPDDLDKCPAEAEDVDGFEDDDGCADPDNDKDGILDGVDKCPNDKGVAEKGGCPETLGDVASKATSATGDFLGNMIELVGFDTKKDPFLGMGVDVSTDVTSPGDKVLLGPTLMHVSWGPLDAGVDFDFDLASDSSVSVPLFFHMYGGLQLFQIPRGDFGLIRPSVGVDGTISPDDKGGIIGGPYVANTFVLWVVRVRAYYRYEMLDSGVGFTYPKNLAGVEANVDLLKLFDD